MFLDFLKSDKIRTSRDLDTFLRAGNGTTSGITVTPENAATYSPVYACAKVIAEDIGKLPFDLMRTEDNKREKAVDERLYSVLHDSPNAFQTSQEWREMVVLHLAFRGNHYSYVNAPRGEVAELLPLNPDAVTPKLVDYQPVYDVMFADGTRDILGADKILHIRLPGDMIEGWSPIKQNQNAIGLGMATERYGALMFKNGSRPGGILSTDQKLDKEQVESIREQWESTQSGDNAHKAAILSGGLEWTTIGMSAEDSQFIEARKLSRSEIAGIFRVAPHKIGDLERATFSNIEHQSTAHVEDCLMPYITRIENRVNKQLIQRKNKGKQYSKINVNALLRGDTRTRAEFYTRQIQNGALSPNEIRELEDMDPREGGDIFLTPLNMAIDGMPVGMKEFEEDEFENDEE